MSFRFVVLYNDFIILYNNLYTLYYKIMKTFITKKRQIDWVLYQIDNEIWKYLSMLQYYLDQLQDLKIILNKQMKKSLVILNRKLATFEKLLIFTCNHIDDLAIRHLWMKDTGYRYIMKISKAIQTEIDHQEFMKCFIQLHFKYYYIKKRVLEKDFKIVSINKLFNGYLYNNIETMKIQYIKLRDLYMSLRQDYPHWFTYIDLFYATLYTLFEHCLNLHEVAILYRQSRLFLEIKVV